MLLITCPVTRTDELVADRRIRSVANHPTHIAVAVDCPSCGGSHVFRTGRQWEDARTERTARAAAQVASEVASEAASEAAGQAATRTTTPVPARAARVREPA